MLRVIFQNMLPEGKASALEDVTRFNEKEVLENHSSYIVRALEVITVQCTVVVVVGNSLVVG